MHSISSFAENCNESGTSDDYALPPDANDTESMTHAAAQMRISTLERNSGELEKSGYLTKLSGKLKTWRKRWFVLKNGTLSYWKSQVFIWITTILSVNQCVHSIH